MGVAGSGGDYELDMLYSGTVHFTCPLGLVTLPPDYTFTPADRGSHVFNIVVITCGTFVINASDDQGVTGQLHFTRECPPAPYLEVGPEITICRNATNLRAYVFPSAGATTYTWSLTNGTIATGQGTPNITFNVDDMSAPSVLFNVNVMSNGYLIKRYGWSQRIWPLPTATINSVSRMTLCPNTPVTLDVALTGAPPFNLRWSDGFTQTIYGRRVSRTMTFPTSTSVSIAQITDAKCASGTASNTVLIDIGGPPVIAQQPQSTSIRAGDSATLNVSGTGLSYYWYQGEVGDTTNRVANGMSSFTTPPLRETTKYWVRALTNCGFVDSDQAIVTMMPGKHRGAAH